MNASIEQNEIDAERYKAIRNLAKTKEGRMKLQALFWNMSSRKDIDKFADALLSQSLDIASE